MWIEYLLLATAVLAMNTALVFSFLNWRMSINEKEAVAHVLNGRRKLADLHFKSDSIRLVKSFLLWIGTVHLLFWYQDTEKLAALLIVMSVIYMTGLASISYLVYAARYELISKGKHDYEE